MVAAGTPVVNRGRHSGSRPAGTGEELRDAGAGEHGSVTGYRHAGTGDQHAGSMWWVRACPTKRFAAFWLIPIQAGVPVPGGSTEMASTVQGVAPALWWLRAAGRPSRTRVPMRPVAGVWHPTTAAFERVASRGVKVG